VNKGDTLTFKYNLGSFKEGQKFTFSHFETVDVVTTRGIFKVEQVFIEENKGQLPLPKLLFKEFDEGSEPVEK
jgi:hypothetical protein